MINVNSFYVSLYFYIVSYIMSLNIQLHFKIFITRRDKIFLKKETLQKTKYYQPHLLSEIELYLVQSFVYSKSKPNWSL